MGGMKNIGAIAAKVTIPTAMDEPVMSKTSQPRATISAQAAACAAITPSHIVRNSGYWSARTKRLRLRRRMSTAEVASLPGEVPDHVEVPGRVAQLRDGG